MKSNTMDQNQEQKRERFKRLATQRTNTVLQKLKVLGNCSNRSAYDYTEEEINKIFSEIERKTREMKAKFHFPKNKEFKL
jgi:Neuraminidase (sialidase)